ncbi:MAG: DUF2007 domain-containing protein [Planctomycetales bacterium]|nr:DUF2007 domain-containing protein [Planctomycetales bacterium]
MSEELVVVGTYWDFAEVHLAQSALDRAGIESVIENEFSSVIAPHLTQSSGARLMVRPQDLEAARRALPSA